MSKDKLQWITISSDQAILMSVCLQSMVDELLLKKNGLKKNQSDCGNRNSWSYMKRDGSSQLISPSQSPVTDGHAVSNVIVLLSLSLVLSYVTSSSYSCTVNY